MVVDYLRPPRIIKSPGVEYADGARCFQGIPGIERAPGGRLWVTWYGGGLGEDRHNYVVLVTSCDGGTAWSAPRLVIDPDGHGPVRAFDPCLWHDPTGRMWLFWAQGYEGHEDEFSGVWAIHTNESEEKDPTWSEPIRICDGIMLNKPTVLSSGHWLLPTARWGMDGSARVTVSTDAGGSWRFLGQATIRAQEDRNCDEHMIIERQDGSLWLLVRTKYGIGESTSADMGSTWSEVKPSHIQHATSRFFIRRLSSGRLVLVKHGPILKRTARSHLCAYLSENEGLTWFGGLLLDERTGVSYPDGVQARDGKIHIVYDYERRGAKEILLAVFTEEDVAAGELVSGRAVLRLLVNKATGKNPNAGG